MTSRGDEDFVLLQAWREGRAAAGNALAERYYTGVYRFFERREHKAAEDLTQKTFLLCVEGRDRFGHHGTFRSYLFAIAWRQLMRHFRDARGDRTAVTFEEDEFEPTPVRGLATLTTRRKEYQVLLAALETLPEELQAVVGLHYWEGLSLREIADVFGVNDSTMRSRIVRARQLLAQELELMRAGSTAAGNVLSDLDGWARAIVQGVEMRPPALPLPRPSKDSTT